ncbi:MFS transporter [Klebsiella quasipneumoniae]|uniref:MFS transporter n=1 Tax=Klebsiella quasipneumoniae TaxID=1463165 RepID=UPI001F59A3C1|nr:MFS transporter [Klebsiella quasipneumoniae]MCI2969168.1 MFS transporter [Klebsiella quasipneumoniae]MCU6520585.1 MFS transporter [Klebsiella quasipneumoniae]HCI4233187.1 MFS transporter [Klebsiella quasipneumoniae subsp. similipneumoniae]HCM5202295.1 MFS transporter [Klebsiella quasipneumoniae subsp. similipneumoniae]
MSSTPVTDNALSRPAGLVVSLRLLAAIVIFAAIAPGILMTAPAVAAQLAGEWQLKPGQVGWLFSAELGAMSLATLPAWWWMSRLDWRRVALTAGGVFLIANLASAVVTQYETLLAARFIASLAGGTLMILCISCAAGTPNPSRVYAFWVLGQLLLGMLGLLALPGLFATFGLKVVYLILAAIMLCCLPLVSAFPPRFQPLSASRQQPSTALWRQALAVLAVLTFYISLSAVWTFIGTIGSTAGLSPTQVGLVLAAATVCGIIGAGGAALRGTRRADRLPVWLGYGLLIVSVGLLVGQPLLALYAIAALLFKFTWTFVLPFILARVAGLDNSGRLMNSINLVIGGGMAAGPALAGALLQRFASADPLLAAAGVCALLSLILIVAASAAGKG